MAHRLLSLSVGQQAEFVQGVCLSAYAVVQTLLVLYASHRYAVLWRWWRRSGARRVPSETPRPARWPHVTVQLPIYNERCVVERLIDSVAALDYPRDALEIQVLDDSTDETSALAAGAVARHRSRGIDIHWLHRPRREGFKAGALAAGLRPARGEFIAIFDADFLPPRDFLRRALPHFDHDSVGMVQARWGHLNRDRSAFTQAQAVMLDAHFLLEHATRMENGLFFNFNGTAGVWRRSCIEDAGGWSHDTLTEDLDLSYRAQLRGWRFRFVPDLVAPAELPADIGALKSQQRRWTKGSIQTARKLLPSIFARGPGRRVELEALVHLTSNISYVLLLALGLLLLPVLLGDSQAPPWLAWTIQGAVWVFGVVPTLAFLIAGQREAGVAWRRIPRDVACAMVLGIGLSLNNTRAVLEGLGSRVGRWERTPKTGDRGRGATPRHPADSRGRMGAGELSLTAYFAAVCVFAWLADRHAAPFALLLLLGFGSVAWASIARRRA